jgi:uncharacterized protein (TIGR02145 family)
LPSDNEWQKLVDFAGGDKIAGKRLKAKSGWSYNNISGKSGTGNGTDKYGFSALPAGTDFDGSFVSVGYFGYWWSSTENDASRAYDRYMYYYNADVDRNYFHKSGLFSVRCLQD